MPEPENQETTPVTLNLTHDVAFDLLSAVGHYRQYTDSVEAFARSAGAQAEVAQLARIARSMDVVAEQLLAQGAGE